MRIWQKDPVYVVLHVLSGVACYFIPAIIPLVVGYHALQYILDVRFFGLEGKIRQGNSLEHTAVKLAEVLAGYLLAKVVYTP
jgi:hypothetical protein